MPVQTPKRQLSVVASPAPRDTSSKRDQLASRSSCPTTPIPKRLRLSAEASTDDESSKEPKTARSDPQEDLAAGEEKGLAPAQYPLVARESECAVLDDFYRRCLSARSSAAGPKGCQRGGCLYVSGGPGTGKTCSVRAAAAAWKSGHQGTEILEVNCMQLTQRSATGLLKRLVETAQARLGTRTAVSGITASTGPGLVAAAAALLSRLGPSVIVICDEVDQILADRKRRHGGAAGSHDPLELLFSLVDEAQGGQAIALVTVANAVDLLARGQAAAAPHSCCDSLLFQPYTAVQLRSILQARLAKAGATGAAAALALGPVGTELRVRQVANRSGDCRQVVCMCEQALFEVAASISNDRPGEAAAGTDLVTTSSGAASERAPPATPPKRLPPPRSMQNDPLAQVKSLPLEQQILLCTLSGSKGEAMRVQDICVRYKEFCRRLHQPPNLASKDQVSSALSALEQRGLLSLRAQRRAPLAMRGGGRGRASSAGARSPGAAFGGGSDAVAELAVSCKAVRETIKQTSPLLEACLE